MEEHFVKDTNEDLAFTQASPDFDDFWLILCDHGGFLDSLGRL